MSKTKYIVFLVAVALTACGVNQLPIDDAYYWPDKNAEVSAPAVQTVSQPAQAAPAEPAVEYTHVSDTVVTIRIKK